MWIGFQRNILSKPDMSLPPGAPGHLQPQDGPVFKRKRPPVPGAGVDDMIHADEDDPANNAAPNTPW